MKDEQHYNQEHFLKFLSLDFVETEIENMCFRLKKCKFTEKGISYFNKTDFHSALLK